MQAGAPHEHIVQLEYAGPNRRREPECPPGESARQERLRELGRKAFVEREPAELCGGRLVLAAQMTLVCLELLLGEHAFLRA